MFPNVLQPINPRRVVTVPNSDGSSWLRRIYGAYKLGRGVYRGAWTAKKLMDAYSRFRDHHYYEAYNDMKGVFRRAYLGAYDDDFLREYDHHGYEAELFCVC